jgi:hypothetical protein
VQVGNGCLELYYLCSQTGNFRLLLFDNFGLLLNEHCLFFDYYRCIATVLRSTNEEEVRSKLIEQRKEIKISYRRGYFGLLYLDILAYYTFFLLVSFLAYLQSEDEQSIFKIFSDFKLDLDW